MKVITSRIGYQRQSILQFFIFKMVAIRHVGFVWRIYLYHLRRVLMVFIIVQNLVVINAAVSITGYESFNIPCVWLENAHSRPKIGVSGDFTLKWGTIITKHPKGTSLFGTASSSLFCVKIDAVFLE